jgi:ABC-2 type transport system ATP-binding protein
VDELAISCHGLGKRYGSVVALDGLELEVPQRSLFGFLGPNGAGKTTLMRLLMGLASPSEGTARVMGHDVVRESLEVRRRVGYLPQQPRFHDELTAREVLRYARGFYPREPDSRIEDDITDSLDLVGLSAKADSRSGDLSGGQRQRLGIAQAQIHRPELLILDEPAAALDPVGRRDVLAVMQRLRGSATVFYSTHILDDVQRVSDEVAILKDGRRVLQSAMEDLLAGDGGIEYVLTLTGPVEAAVAELDAQPWVAAVSGRRDGDGSVVTVRVTDDAAARRHLLRLVLRQDAVDVVGFGRRRSELEDVFMSVVEGGRHERVGPAGAE